MRASLLAAASLALLAAPALAASATGDRVLVILDPKIDKGDYSKFFGSLKDRGYTLTFKKPTDESWLQPFGVPAHDHLVLFAPEAEKLSEGFNPQNVLAAQSEFLNTLHILSPSLSELQRDTLREYDIEAAPRGLELVDAFSHVAGSEIDTVVLDSSALVGPSPILGESKTAGPVVYAKGTGFRTGLNPFLVDIATAPSTSYIADEEGKPVEVKAGRENQLAGSKVSVVGAMQNRNNVRVGFVGSPDLLSDAWWGKKLDGKETGNRAFVDDLTKWIFQETGVVRVVNTTHHRQGETEPRDQYRKKDTVTYNITLTQHSTAANGSSQWVPFSTKDLQLEFTMLDPFIRTALVEKSSSASDTTYSTSFVAPDRHGVFKFVVSHWRPGWTSITTEDKASVVPLRHDEHPRWITGAYPFYTGALSTSAAFLLFVALWASLAEGDKKKKKAE
ncbi:Dolichyl-diphosphooligosaccharide--protein glycosyltransferase subunit [Vanrija pseudolonga]|uniref:Dolichyl-diphosphooligosaccharide--protein glycosyltransferase subunit WBP1 n=1 Tax=Vanrija pseudolonga TaxID=143232 RepID=A0AAF0Y5K7_9TREE|nr:Dolichyl-diphosphooligosaccharide--protein glycosyltransferase subunit [Vanrija pseudolonga]